MLAGRRNPHPDDFSIREPVPENDESRIAYVHWEPRERQICSIYKALRVTPAMAAGITDRLWSLEDIVAKIDAMAPAPKARGPYKQKEQQ